MQKKITQTKKPVKKYIYVIHEHHATHLHWDLRLEFNGVLKSWALPKRPDGSEKQLAVQVDDHALEYAKFHGTIPEGNYGAGLVKIWDKGWFVPVNVKKEKIIADIHGKKLQGVFVLIKFRGNNWLFFRKKSDN